MLTGTDHLLNILPICSVVCVADTTQKAQDQKESKLHGSSRLDVYTNLMLVVRFYLGDMYVDQTVYIQHIHMVCV